MPTISFKIDVDQADAVRAIAQVAKSFDNVNVSINNTAKETETAFGRMDKVLGKMRSAVIGFVSAFVFREAIRGMSDIIDAGVQFEDSFGNVKKTVEGTAVEFDNLSDKFRQLSKEIPVGVNEINRIAEAAGQVGVGVKDIEEFTKTISTFSSATRIGSDEAAVSLARLGALLGEPIEKTKILASTIVDLDSKNRASAQEITQFALNIAQAGRKVGMTTTDTLGLATALASTGLHAEKAGSAISRVLIEMLKDVDGDGSKAAERLKLLGDVAGVTGEKFQKMFKANAGAAFQAFVQGLSDLGKAGQSDIPILDKLGLSNIRIEDVVGRLALTTKDLTKAQADARAEWGRGGEALKDRLNIELEKSGSSLEIVKNRINDVFISISKDLLPTIVSAARDFASLVEVLHDNGSTIKNLVETVGLFAAAWAGIRFAQWVSGAIAATDAMKALNVMMVAGKVESIAFAEAFATLTLAILRIAAWAAAAGAVYKLVEAYNDMKDAQEGVLQSSLKMNSQASTTLKNMEDLGMHFQDFIKPGEGDVEMIDLVNRMTPMFRLLQFTKDANAEADERAAKAAKDHRDAIKLVSDEEAKRNARIKEMADRVFEVTKKDQEWVAALNQAAARGASWNAMIAEFGDKIKEVYSRAQMMGRVGSLDLLVAALGEFQVEQKETSMNMKDNEAQLDAMIHKELEAAKAIREVGQAQFETNNRIAESHPITSVIQNAGLGPKIFDPNGFIGPTLDDPELYKKVGERMDKLSKDFGSNVEKDVDRALDGIFRKFVEKGRISWKDVADFGVKAFDAVIDELFKPLRESIAKLIKTVLSGEKGDAGVIGALTGGLKGLGDKIGKLFGSGSGLGKAIGDVLAGGVMGAISAGISFLVGLFGKSGSEVNNKLVKDIQDPFSKAVTDLMTSFEEMRTSGKLTLETAVAARANLATLYATFQKDTGAYAALGTKNATAVKGAFETIFKYWGQDLDKLFGEIDGSIVELGGHAGMTADDLKDLDAALQIAADFANAVKSITEQFTGAADNADALATALKQLMDMGIPAETIVEKLATSIEETITQMHELGLTVPPIIQEFADMISTSTQLKDATDALNKAMDRQKAITDELTTIQDQLSQAFNQKINKLESDINTAIQAIQNWRGEITGIEKDIADAKDKLSSAEYWQQEYNKALGDAENNYKSAIKNREDVEKQIADLTKQIETDKLNDIIKNSKSQTLVKLAQARLTAMAKEEEEARVQQLQALKDSLPGLIKAEQDAKDLYDQKAIAAQAAVDKEKQELQVFILSKEAERDQLFRNIEAEQERITVLEREAQDTLDTMKRLGIARDDEMTSIDNTIKKLLLRKTALEDEAAALYLSIAAIQALISSLTSIHSTVPNTDPSIIPPSGIGDKALPTGGQLLPPGTGPTDGASAAGPFVPGTGFNFNWKHAASGIEYARRTTPVIIHEGEGVLTKGENAVRMSGGVNLKIGSIQIIAPNGKEAAQEFVRELETNAALRSRLVRAVK